MDQFVVQRLFGFAHTSTDAHMCVERTIKRWVTDVGELSNTDGVDLSGNGQFPLPNSPISLFLLAYLPLDHILSITFSLTNNFLMAHNKRVEVFNVQMLNAFS